METTDTRRETETIGEAALRLLARLDARTRNRFPGNLNGREELRCRVVPVRLERAGPGWSRVARPLLYVANDNHLPSARRTLPPTL